MLYKIPAKCLVKYSIVFFNKIYYFFHRCLYYGNYLKKYENDISAPKPKREK